MTPNDTPADSRSPRAVVTLMMALTGALFFFVFLLEEFPRWSDADWAEIPWVRVALYIGVMGLGGALSGALFTFMFGRRGILGWILSLLGGVIATIFAGIFGGAVSRIGPVLADGFGLGDVIALAAGAMVPVFAIASYAWVVVPWLGLVAATHVRARAARMGA